MVVLKIIVEAYIALQVDLLCHDFKAPFSSKYWSRVTLVISVLLHYKQLLVEALQFLFDNIYSISTDLP